MTEVGNEQLVHQLSNERAGKMQRSNPTGQRSQNLKLLFTLINPHYTKLHLCDGISNDKYSVVNCTEPVI